MAAFVINDRFDRNAPKVKIIGTHKKALYVVVSIFLVGTSKLKDDEYL